MINRESDTNLPVSSDPRTGNVHHRLSQCGHPQGLGGRATTHTGTVVTLKSAVAPCGALLLCAKFPTCTTLNCRHPCSGGVPAAGGVSQQCAGQQRLWLCSACAHTILAKRPSSNSPTVLAVRVSGTIDGLASDDDSRGCEERLQRGPTRSRDGSDSWMGSQTRRKSKSCSSL